MSTQKQLTHIAGTFVIQADGAFLNGAGLGQGEDRTTTVPKTLLDGKTRIPYVSTQSWRRWLRNTLIEETGWEASEIRAIKFNVKGNTSKVAGEVNPVDFAEDDLFGYMRTGKDEDEPESSEDETAEASESEAKSTQSASGARVKSVMRPSPFASSLLIGIRRGNTRSKDDGTVFPVNGTPLRYSTEFYVANMQAVFCLDYHRLGVFRNIGDRVELAEEFIKPNLDGKKVKVIEDLGAKGQVYQMTDASQRKVRASELLKALAVLRGGAKQAQFGTSVAPNVIIAAGLTCGNPIFNHLFTDDVDQGIKLKIEMLKEVIAEYADRIVTPVFLGIRKEFLANEAEVLQLQNKEIVITVEKQQQKRTVEIVDSKLTLPEEDKRNDGQSVQYRVKLVVQTPREAMMQLAEKLP